MRIVFTITVVLFLTVLNVYPQNTVYEIPFDSKDNRIELEVVNNSGIQTQAVRIKIIDKPEWVKFKNTEIQVTDRNNIAEFNFNILKEAPVGKETTLKFIVEDEAEVVGGKEIKITIAAPFNYELHQNYPNPFNPSTTISYQLPQLSKVNLKVYDILGSEVETIIDKEQPAGFHKQLWNASKYASGIYVYQLVAKTKTEETKFFRKKMMVVK